MSVGMGFHLLNKIRTNEQSKKGKDTFVGTNPKLCSSNLQILEVEAGNWTNTNFKLDRGDTICYFFCNSDAQTNTQILFTLFNC